VNLSDFYAVARSIQRDVVYTVTPMAEAFFRHVSKRRESLSDWLWPEECVECNDLDLDRKAS